jgi:hypothetical protein
MTVIMGLNLSDKVYLAGDSRLSYYEGGQTYTRHDNIQKVENISGNPSITVASAGDARFAKTIINKLKTTELLTGISDLRAGIETWIGPVVDRYFTQHGYSEVTFIFGGSDPGTKKIISGEQMIAMANAFTGGQGVIQLNSALQQAIKSAAPVPKQDIPLEVPNTTVFSVKYPATQLNTLTRIGESF